MYTDVNTSMTGLVLYFVKVVGFLEKIWRKGFYGGFSIGDN